MVGHEFMQIIKKILINILTWESRLIIGKYKPFIVAITGSVGKTSTKDAIYDVLKDQFRFVRKSEKSMNSDIGLPLTIIGVPNAWYDMWKWLHNIGIGLKLIILRAKYPNCLILEVGADHPGDIRKVAKWLAPDITVITRISRMPVHVEFFNSPDEVFEEKSWLVKALKANGTLVVFGDDEKTLSLDSLVKDRNVSVISYGLGEKNQIRGSDLKALYENNVVVGMTFNIHDNGILNTINIVGILGDAYVYPLLAAYAVGKARGMMNEQLCDAIKTYDAPKGRMNIIRGMNGSTLIDDTYNSSPDAVSSALVTLKNLVCGGSKIAVLGDMLELGKYSSDEHRKVGVEVAQIANLLVTVGQRSRSTAEEAIKNGFIADNVKSFSSSIEAGVYLNSIVKSGDIVLIKGSQSMRTERITASLLLEPEKAGKLLVRQEKEWLDKK